MIQELKKKHGSGTTILIISDEEMNDIMKIAETLEDSNILLKGVTKTFKNKTKEQKGGFLSMLLRTIRDIITFVRKFISRKRNCKSWFRK